MVSQTKFKHFFHLDEVTSTMDEASQKVDEGFTDGLVVTARVQTKGRGRNGKSFSSPKDLGLWVTLGLQIGERLPFDIIKTFSVALAVSLEKDFRIPVKIKWPNDIFCNGKKLCGMLAELHKNKKTILLGFGLNVNQSEKDWESSIAHIATSIRLESGKQINKDELLKDILLAFETALTMDRATINESYRNFSLIWGSYALFNNKKTFVESINDDGSLVIVADGVSSTAYAGDLYLLPPTSKE